MKFTFAQWKLGTILALASSRGLRAVLLGTDSNALIDEQKRQFPEAQYAPLDHALHHILSQLIRYAETPIHPYVGPLDLQGTLFQRMVWNILRSIPRGSQMNYSEVALQLGKPNAYRAVANACAANPLCLVIPCHRVVGKRGLGGYRWGVSLKQELLKHEKYMIS